MHLSTDDVPCDPNLLENAIFSIFLFHHKIIVREKHRLLLLITLTDKKVGYLMRFQHSNYHELYLMILQKYNVCHIFLCLEKQTFTLDTL